MRRAFLILVLVAFGVSVYGYLAYNNSAFVPEVRTVTLTSGDIVDAVGATGALEAVTTVNVGSQVSGTIDSLYVDFNSIVRQGEILMRLEPSLFETQVEQARANLIRAEADTERLRVSVDDARVKLARANELAARQLIAETELEAAQVTLRLAEAQLKSSEAAITQARASLNQNEVNLGHTVIRSPIDGIVISRLVDVGQTVAASLQAPELFVLAADLTKMRVIASIDESDVGRIRPSQRVTFTVDAYPGEEFEGVVSQIRLEPVVTQNVVTYATVIDSPNPDLQLMPGMTATVTLEIARRENVVRVPNAALRFRPTTEMFAVFSQPLPETLQLAAGSGTEEPNATPSFRPEGGERSRFPPAGGRDRFEGGGGGTGNRTPDPERMRQFQERLRQMSPEEREQFMARRATRGGGPDGLGGEPAGEQGAIRRRPANPSREPTVPTVERGATTVDALFGELPVVETTGQVWMMDGDQLRAIAVRLGVTDGTATEFLAVIDPADTDLAPGASLVTNVTTPDNGSSPSGTSGGSPLIPQFGIGRRR